MLTVLDTQYIHPINTITTVIVANIEESFKSLFDVIYFEIHS